MICLRMDQGPQYAGAVAGIAMRKQRALLPTGVLREQDGVVTAVMQESSVTTGSA